jgi:hypothetical protein
LSPNAAISVSNPISVDFGNALATLSVADSRAQHRDRAVHPLARTLVSVLLRGRRAPTENVR